MSENMYVARMNGYYPQVVSCITEFKAIVDALAPEFEELNKSQLDVIHDAYLLTMGEKRIEQWERILKIQPLLDSTLDDRRDTIIARIRGQGKLNTALINSIVNAFTGGTANSWIEDSVLYVEITPPPNNKSFKFANVEQEISKKVPAHIGFQVSRNYYEWGEFKDNNHTWQDMYDLGNWEDVYLFVPFTKNSTKRKVIK